MSVLQQVAENNKFGVTCLSSSDLLKRQSHKMVKHTQKIRQLLLKGLKITTNY